MSFAESVNLPSHPLDEAAMASTRGETSFTYKPLDREVDSFRLLLLHPSKGEKQLIRCQLHHSTFGRKPVYEAISYVWGTDLPTMSILLDEQPFLVRQNPYNALRSISWDIETPLLLWIDAICINQNDFEERTYQVRLMEHIFTRASVVVAWLGLPPDDQGSIIHRDFLATPRDAGFDYLKTWMEWVTRNDYWRRVWVAQEVGLARNLWVRVGHRTKRWEDFFLSNLQGCDTTKWDRWIAYSATGSLVHRYKHSLGFVRALDLKRKGRHEDSNRLENLLEDFQHTMCSEVRDKVYGFLGLAHDCVDDVIIADYEKSLYALYSDVVRLFNKPRLLPSHATNELDRSMRLVRYSKLLQKLLKTSYHEAVPSTDRTFVKVKGAIVGRINYLGPSYHSAIESQSSNRKWRASFADNHTVPQEVQLRREANEAYLGTLLEMEPEELSKYTDIRFDDPCGRFFSAGWPIPASWNNDPDQWHRQDPKEREAFELNRSGNAENGAGACSQLKGSPKLFLGSNMLMGLAPHYSREGDLICQFWETDTVASLRLEESGENKPPILRVVGRGHLNTGTLESLQPVFKKWIPIANRTDAAVIFMDLDVLSFLTC